MSEGLKWIDAENNVYDLNDLDEMITLHGIKGEWMPGFEILSASFPMLAGSRVRQVRTIDRDVDVPVVVRCRTRSALYARLRELAQALDPNRGMGRLQRTAADGVVRELWCRYRMGMESLQEEGSCAVSGVLTFQANDPYWYANSERVVTVDTGLSGITWFGREWFPFLLERSSVFGSVVIHNGGDVTAYPTIIVYGPGTNARIRNLTTGKDMEFTVSLDKGDSIEVDTRPGCKSVKINGESRFDLMSGSLWSLDTGLNLIQVEMSGSAEDSQVTIGFYERFNSA